MEIPADPSWLQGIEGDAPRELITLEDPLICVTAGPGAGKTTCLKCRLERLILGDHVAPRTVFAGTFTRAITAELKKALNEHITVSTLHSLATSLLRQHPQALQGLSLRFLLSFEQDTMLYDVLQELHHVPDIYAGREALRRLQASRAQRTVYQDAAFSGAVFRWLRRHHAITVGDVMHLCVSALESGDVSPGMFDHIILDEYQDLTACEHEFVRLLWSTDGTLTALGDSNQSIYGFRYNAPKGLESFAQLWSPLPVRPISFTENRRSARSIVRFANIMAAEASSASIPQNPVKTEEGSLDLVYWPSLEEEIRGLASFIGSRPQQSFLVLVPKRIIGYRLQEAIGGDASTDFFEGVLEHPISQEALTELSISADQNDLVSARTWLGLRSDRANAGVKRNAIAYGSVPTAVSGRTLIEQIARDGAQVRGQGKTHLVRRAQTALDLYMTDLGPDDAIARAFGAEKANAEDDPEKHQRLLANLDELRQAANTLLANQKEPNLKEIVETIRYRVATRAPLIEPSERTERVRIMTLHGAKGLEADNVIVAGVSDQVIPGEETKEEVVEEQRRLLYVAATRAKATLVISWHQSISYSDAASNRIRRDGGVFFDSATGQRAVRTSKSSLLPQGVGGVRRGEAWLAESTRH